MSLIKYKEPEFKSIVERANKLISKTRDFELNLLKIKNKTFQNYMIADFVENKEFSKEVKWLFNLSYLNNNEEISNIIQEITELYTVYSLEKEKNMDFFNALLEVDKSEMCEIEKKYLKLIIQEKEREGINLPDNQKESLSDISLSLSKLSRDFMNNTQEFFKEFSYEVKEEDLCFYNEDDKKSLLKDDKYLLTNLNEAYDYIKLSPNRVDRKKLSDMLNTRTPENEELIKDILKKRNETIDILDFETYADLVFEERDASNPKVVFELLEELLEKAIEPAKKDLNSLFEYAKENNIEIDKIKRSDIAHLSYLYKKDKYDIDMNYIKQFFEVNNVLNVLFAKISTYFDITAIEVSEFDKWNEHVKLYKFVNKDEEIVGHIYFDLFERKNKNQGAWASGLESYHKNEEGKIVKPTGMVVCNYKEPNNEGYSLLTLSDIITLFHEMGHAMHHLFSEVKTQGIGGTNVLWDVVEFPSQFFELFANEKDTIKELSSHYKTGEKLENEIIDKMINSKNFLSGFNLLVQTAYALIDLRLHTDKDGELFNIIESVLRESFDKIDLQYNKEMIYTFSHIFAGGYAAGYYSYKWAEILSASAYVYVLNSEDIPKEMKRYREIFLSKGGTIDMVSEFKKFTGYQPNVEDLLRLDGLI